MAVTVEASGTQTAVINTEHTLHTNSGAKVFCLIVDTVNMVNDDVLELRIKIKTLSGSTVALVYFASYSHAQDELVKISIPVPSPGHSSGAVFTLKQTAGTGRNFDWSVVSL